MDSNLFKIGALALAALLFLGKEPSTKEKRESIIKTGLDSTIANSMSEQEIKDLYFFIIEKNADINLIPVAVQQRLSVISDKYGIFN